MTTSLRSAPANLATRAVNTAWTAGKILISVVLVVFGLFAIVNFFAETAVGLLQLAIWAVVLLPSYPLLYAIEAKHRSLLARILLAVLSLAMWALILLAIYVYS